MLLSYLKEMTPAISVTIAMIELQTGVLSTLAEC